MEWLNYHHLFYFWMVCKEDGFAKAADRLRVSQSAVSIQVRQLEEFFGQKLMDRGPRRFKLTEAGQVVLAESEKIFSQGTDLVHYFRTGKMWKKFRVGAPGALSKNLQIKILKSAIDDPGVELSLEAGDPQLLLERLLNYQLDAVITDVPFPSSEAEPLIQSEIASETVCLVGKRSQPRSRDLSSRLATGVFVPARSSPMTAAIIESLEAEHGRVQVKGFIDDIAVLRLLALETEYPVAIPRIGVRRELENKELLVLHEFKKIQQQYHLVYRQRGKRHPLLKLISAR